MADILFPQDTSAKATPTTSDLILLADVADSNNPKDATLGSLPISTATQTALGTKQATLVSGTNIKTVNGNSLLGSGDLTISGSGSVATDTIWDAKGDLAVGTGANTASRLPVGLNGQILVADSAEATGVKWATASGSGDMLASTYDPANIAQQVVGTTATQTISGKTLTTPRFADLGFIADQNGNEMLAFNSNASAVNYLELENGTTTNPPYIRSKGDDTNIELHLVAKGTGLVSVCDSTDETKRIRFQASGNSTGVITTIASSDTTAHTITLPNATDTLVGRTTTDTLTNKTLTSPTLITPVLGTPSSGVATNLTGTATGLTSGITNALKSATTTVDVSAATAPSSGQVLTATSSTTATWQTPSGGGGGLTRDIWYALSGTFATATTFTTTESSNAEATRLAGLAERCLFTCTNSGGGTRRIGYIKSASASTTTITYTVVTDSDLASGDTAFKISPDRAVEDYRHLISIPGELIADASNPQGLWLLNVKRDSYLLPVSTAVRTAAAGAGAACAYNIYKGATNLFTTAPDMTTNATLNDQRPNTNTTTAGDNISLRITASAGATNKASDFQAELYLVPQKVYTSQ